MLYELSTVAGTYHFILGLINSPLAQVTTLSLIRDANLLERINYSILNVRMQLFYLLEQINEVSQ